MSDTLVEKLFPQWRSRTRIKSDWSNTCYEVFSIMRSQLACSKINGAVQAIQKKGILIKFTWQNGNAGLRLREIQRRSPPLGTFAFPGPLGAVSSLSIFFEMCGFLVKVSGDQLGPMEHFPGEIRFP